MITRISKRDSTRWKEEETERNSIPWSLSRSDWLPYPEPIISHGYEQQVSIHNLLCQKAKYKMDVNLERGNALQCITFWKQNISQISLYMHYLIYLPVCCTHVCYSFGSQLKNCCLWKECIDDLSFCLTTF